MLAWMFHPFLSEVTLKLKAITTQTLYHMKTESYGGAGIGQQWTMKPEGPQGEHPAGTTDLTCRFWEKAQDLVQ